MRPKSSFYASDNLRLIYKARVGNSMTQEEFAKKYHIGGQSMIAQILSGAKPLPIETAPKLARALQCTIDDICPEMATYIRGELIPAVGKTVRRVIVLALVSGAQFFAPSGAEANAVRDSAQFNITLNALHIAFNVIRRWFRLLFRCPIFS